MSASFTQTLADFFKAHPALWIDGRQLASIAGAYAWRSRVAECRTQLGMDIQNRQTRIPGERAVISEYRFIPAAPVEVSAAHDLNAWSLR